MKKVIAYVLYGKDNGGYMLAGLGGLNRCVRCGALIEKPRFSAAFKLLKKLDVSCTCDGCVIVSTRFVEAWTSVGGRGLVFLSLASSPGYFAVDAADFVDFDTARRGTRFEGFCEFCNQYRSIAGATPAFLKSQGKLVDNHAVKTDIMFGSADGRNSLIIIPFAVGNELRRLKLSGLELDEVFE